MMNNTKPVTIRAGTVGEVTPLQQEGLDRVVEYLTRALHPGQLLPETGRIVIEWGSEADLDILRADEENTDDEEDIPDYMLCPQCGRQLTGVEYDWRAPEYYDGVSEWACFPCGYHRGRWSGKLLGDGEKEPKYGRK